MQWSPAEAGAHR